MADIYNKLRPIACVIAVAVTDAAQLALLALLAWNYGTPIPSNAARLSLGVLKGAIGQIKGVL